MTADYEPFIEPKPSLGPGNHLEMDALLTILRIYQIHGAVEVNEGSNHPT